MTDSPAIPIRRAAGPDIPALVALCRESFPASLRWQVSEAPARLWWRSVIERPHAEAWVTDEGAGPRGFIVLVTDETAWARDLRCTPRRAWLAAIARHPLRAARRAMARRRGVGRETLSDLPAVGATAPARRTWIELIAVAPALRGHGDAAALIALALERTRVLGRDAVQLAVAPANAAAVRCYARAGFGLARSGAARLVLARLLPSEAAPRPRGMTLHVRTLP